MAKHWSFHVQSCLGMVWNLFENLDFRTILTHSDLRKGTLTNFGHFDSQHWVTDKDHPELLSLNILCADRFKPKHRIIQKNNVQCPMSNVQCPMSNVQSVRTQSSGVSKEAAQEVGREPHTPFQGVFGPGLGDIEISKNGQSPLRRLGESKIQLFRKVSKHSQT